MGDLLRRVQAMATQSRLTIRGFTPRSVTRRQMHAEWPIGLQLEGTYHDLGTFLERVSKFPRIINVGTIHIKAQDVQSGVGDDHRGLHRDDVRVARSATCGSEAGAWRGGDGVMTVTRALVFIPLTVLLATGAALAQTPQPAAPARRTQPHGSDAGSAGWCAGCAGSCEGPRGRREARCRRAAGIYLQPGRASRSLRQPVASRCGLLADQARRGSRWTGNG